MNYFHPKYYSLREYSKDQKYILKLLLENYQNYSPYFIFSHITISHPPFVFDENGNFNIKNAPFSWGIIFEKGIYKQRYLAQIKFLEKKIIEVIDHIKTNSPNSIIIIHSDHGSDLELRKGNYMKLKEYSDERSKIFYTIYFPDNDYRKLYNSISPVNTFRIIFNKYLNTDFPILKDINYTHSLPREFEFYKTFNN